MFFESSLLKAFGNFSFYTSGIKSILGSKFFIENKKNFYIGLFNSLSDDFKCRLIERVSYYNKIDSDFSVFDNYDERSDFYRNSDFYWRGKKTAYFIDMKKISSLYDDEVFFRAIFGDVNYTPECFCFVKSRPVVSGNANAVVLKLNSFRHFYVERDSVDFNNKESKLVWRGAAHQAHRLSFLESYHSVAKFDLACTHKKSYGKPYHGSYMSVSDQLKFKYILSIEGNDVATNLKWIMASNSLCFMRKPRFETWFMEGRLIPGYHYVLLKDDYSDMEEKVDYYEERPDEAAFIINNANNYIADFYKADLEMLVSFLVFEKYLKFSGQADHCLFDYLK